MNCERTTTGPGIAATETRAGSRARYIGHCQIDHRLFYLGLNRATEFGPTADGKYALKLVFMWRPRPEARKRRWDAVPHQFGFRLLFRPLPFRWTPTDRGRWASIL